MYFSLKYDLLVAGEKDFPYSIVSLYNSPLKIQHIG